MPILRIDLQEGFDDETVVVRVNGEEIFNKGSVKTRSQIGVADAFETDVPEGSTLIEIVLPLKNISESVEVQVEGPLHLGVSINGEGQIEYRSSQEPFGYV